MKLSKLSAVAITIAALGLSALPAQAGGVPTFDGANVTQSTISALQDVQSVLKQIEQYRLQLKQYENQLRNTAAPAAYIWDRTRQTIDGLNQAMAELRAKRQQLGNIRELLDRYQSSEYYKGSPCYRLRGCTAAERAQLERNRDQISTLQKLTNDSVLMAIDQQLESIKQDLVTLERLQRASQSAKGQMEAIQYGNQLRSAQIHQTMQLRQVILMNMQAAAVERQARIDQQAREAAASKQFWSH